MTNPDTNTLNGALEQLGITMADNLVTMGVSDADPSDGLTTLAGKILTIPSGGSCYHIEFSEDSYTAVGGTATLEIILQENYAPKSGATVTVTGSDSSLYTGLTDSTGVATVTVSNVSTVTTFTASYNNVSANCTVTVPTVLFEDACSSADGLSNYGAIRAISSSTTTSQLEYNSTNNAYYVHANGDWGIIPITALNGLEDYKITAEFKTKNSGNTYQGGLGFIAQNSTNNIIFRKYGTSCNSLINASSDQQSIGSCRSSNSYWHKFEITKQGKEFSITVTDMGNGATVGTQTRTVTFDPYYCGLMVVAGTTYGSYVRNIKAEYL